MSDHSKLDEAGSEKPMENQCKGRPKKSLLTNE